MDDGIVLLTDDEVVALCAIDGRPWPLGLITVGTSLEELTQAAVRGVRSLLVRRLMTESTDGRRSPDPTLARDVAAFIDATDRVGVHLAPTADHTILAGASVTAAHTGDGWLLDAATADGVHSLRRCSASEAASAIIGFVEAVLEEGRDDLTCVVRRGHAGETTIAVGDRSAWKPDAVREAFGAGQPAL